MTETETTGGRRTTQGAAVEHGGLRVIPEAQTIVWSRPWGGMVWNRPTAVYVLRGKDEERVAIRDATRMAQIVCYGLAGIAVLIGLFGRRSNEQ